MPPDRPSWHVQAARMAARQPWRQWSDICAELGRKPRKKRVPVASVVRRLEQLKLW